MLSQDVRNHILSCDNPDCLCNTIDVPHLYKTLIEELPSIPHELQAQRPENSRALPDTWLHLEPFTRVDFFGKPCGKFLGYTCWLCRSAGRKAGASRLGSCLQANAKMFRSYFFHRHQRSACHKNSVRVLLGQATEAQKKADKKRAAPSPKEFLDILQAVRKGNAPSAGLGGFRSKKTCKMV